MSNMRSMRSMRSINLHQLIKDLSERHISIALIDRQLSINAPKGALTETIINALRQHKSALIDLLSEQQSASNAPMQIIPDKKNLHEPFPFSDLQVAFYMAGDAYMEYHVQPHYYNEFNRNELNVVRYERAINLALQRHQGDVVLITDDEQLQVINPLPPIHCQIHDFTASSVEQREKGLIAIREKMMRQELSLNQWPWIIFEISVWQEHGKQYARIHSNINNFYSDGFGLTTLYKEIEAFHNNPELVLPPLELAYRDAVLGLKALSESPEGEQAKQYWLSRLPYLPDPPTLPQLSNVNRKCRSRLQRRENTLPEKVWSAIKQEAANYGLTPSSVIITAYAELLSLWSGSQHFILSNMVTRRLPIHPQIKDIIGNFASLYPLEIDLRGSLSFANKALRIQQQILMDSGKRQWGGMQVMQAFNQLKGEFGSVPCPFVIGSALFMDNYEKPDFSCLETAQTILDHQFWELNNGDYFYVWDLLEEFFPAGMIESMWATFHQLLQRLGENSQAWQEKVLSISPIAFPNNANHDMPIPNGLLHQGLASTLKTTPDKALVSTPTGDYSYRDIDHHSECIAQVLSTQELSTQKLSTQVKDAQKNKLVVIIMDRSEQLLAAAIGVLKAGSAYVPIDPSLPCERIQYLLSNTKTNSVLTGAEYYQKVVDICQKNYLNKINVINVEQLKPSPIIENAAIEDPVIDDKETLTIDTSNSNLAYVIYTSGSTGEPKGVMIDHRGALNTVKDINRRFTINQHDTVLGVSSFSFDLSVYDIFGVLDAGATVVYPEPTAAYNPAHWLTLLDEKSVTVWNSAPPLMTLLLETALRQKASLPNLRVVMLSGDWIPLELYSQLQQVAPNAQLISLGGATEASIWSIYYPVKQPKSQWNSIPYGKPLANQGWQIRDSLNRQVPLWTVGELWITGVGLAKGYWQDTEKTQRSFIVDNETGEHAYRTGDLGRYLPDGTIEFMGRIDAQVKIQGYRVELGEIETTLTHHESVKQAVVLAEIINNNKDNHKDNHKDKQLVAFIVLNNIELNSLNQIEKQTLRQQTIEILSRSLKQSLPTYMIPHTWALLSSIPLTRNGKIDRKALLAIEHSSHQSQQYNVNQQHMIAPRNPIEHSLTTIWATVLTVEKVSINDDFFDLGGRSFDAVRCVALIKEQLDKTLSLGDMWECRTIARLAEHINNDTDDNRRLTTLKTGDDNEDSNNGDSNNGDSNKEVNERLYFMIHPGGGQVVGYYPLAEQLNGSSFGLFALEEDVDNGGMDSIEAIAQRYLPLVRNQQKDRQKKVPYTLIGWSSGSYIAFEIAFQLEQLGETVSEVFIIDAPAPMQHLPILPIDMLKGFFEDLGLGLDTSFIDTLYLSEQDEKKQFTFICDHFNRRQTIALNANQLYPMFRVFNACVNASRNYDPLMMKTQSSSLSKSKLIRALITVIRAQEGTVTEFSTHPYQNDLDWGWSHLSQKETGAFAISATHHTVLQEPLVKAVADIINGCSNVNTHDQQGDSVLMG